MVPSHGNNRHGSARVHVHTQSTLVSCAEAGKLGQGKTFPLAMGSTAAAPLVLLKAEPHN